MTRKKTTSPITPTSEGVTWTEQPGDSYLVTGTLLRGGTFRRVCATWQQARCINVWRGRKYLVRAGRRHLIQTIHN